jgi:uncharacterized membrane protein YhaH (DUF805 family)
MLTSPTKVIPMTPINAVKSVFTKYAIFRGTASRSEYWWWTLASTIVAGVLNALTGDLDNPNMAASTLALVWAVGTLIPTLAVTVRRFHDAGLSGKWLLTLLIPVVAVIASISQIVAIISSATEFTDDIVIAIAGALVPTILTALAVGLFQFIVTLLPSKTAEQGNRHA